MHAPFKVALQGDRVGELRGADAAEMRDPVPDPLVTRSMATDIKRVPDVEAGMKFSLVAPLCGHSACLFVARRLLARSKDGE